MDWRNDWQSLDTEGLFLGDSRISTGKIEADGKALHINDSTMISFAVDLGRPWGFLDRAP